MQEDEVWTYEPGIRGGFTVSSKTEYIVGTVDEEGRYGAIDSEEHAALISLVPEMFKALKYARRFLNSEDHDIAYIDYILAKAQEKFN